MAANDGVKTILKNAEIGYGARLVETYKNTVNINLSAQRKPCTNFASPGDFEEYGAGNKEAGADFNGFWAKGAQPNRDFWYKDSALWWFSPDRPGVEGASGLVYFMNSFRTQYNAQHDVGEFSRANLQVAPSGGVILGHFLGSADVSATGAVNGGATKLQYDEETGVIQGRELVLALAVQDPGTSFEVKVERASDAVFTTPADVHTFTVVTEDHKYEIVRIPGPITDEYYRANVVAITGTAKYRLMAGII